MCDQHVFNMLDSFAMKETDSSVRRREREKIGGQVWYGYTIKRRWNAIATGKLIERLLAEEANSDTYTETETDTEMFILSSRFAQV